MSKVNQQRSTRSTDVYGVLLIRSVYKSCDTFSARNSRWPPEELLWTTLLETMI
jgi:hypothetical protein